MRRKLGKMEMAQAYTNEVYNFNAVVALRMVHGPTVETLKLVLKYLQSRHPLLGVHIEKEKKQYFFESKNTPKIPLFLIDRQADDQWQRVVEEELANKIDMFTGPLVHFTYITNKNKFKESEIIITFQHSIMDAVSTASLLHEMLIFCMEVETKGNYDEFEQVEALSMTPPTEQLLPPGYKGMKGSGKKILFMLRQMVDEIQFQWTSRKKRKPSINETGKCKILPLKLSREISEALFYEAHKKRLTLNNLLIAALLMAVHKLLYNSEKMSLRHICTVDLRPYLHPPLEAQNFGSYFSMLRSTIRMKENIKIWELAEQIDKIILPALKRGDKYFSSLLSYAMMKMLFRFKSFRMSASALSFTGFLNLNKEYGKLQLNDVHAFPPNFVVGPEYSAIARVFDYKIYWDFLYLDSDMNQQRARMIADEIFRILESSVEKKSK